MFGYHYSSSLRRYIILMGQLFNGIQVRRVRDGQSRFIKVPITYSNKEKFMMSLDKVNNIASEADVAKVETILPRMCLSLVGMDYQANYKTNIRNRAVPQYDAGRVKLITQYNPVPYRLTFELGIYTRHEDDMFQIVEQILPYFQPHFNCKIKELHGQDIWIDRDIQVTITGVTPDERSSEDRFSRRRLEWSIMFDFIGWIYPPSVDVTNEIRTVYLDFHANEVELTSDGSNFESVDTQVSPVDVEKGEWDGSVKQTYSRNTPRPTPPTPPQPRIVKEF